MGLRHAAQDGSCGPGGFGIDYATEMAVQVTEFEDTPNPNAMKCWVDATLSDGPLSFFNAAAAAEHPLASRLFEEAGVTNVLILGDWVTICKTPKARWPAVKKKVAAVLASYEAG